MKNFDFLGFEASASLSERSRETLQRLLKLAPGIVGHDAYIILAGNGSFEGSLKIHTAWESFSAGANFGSPELVLEALYDKMNSQISEWRRARTPVLPASDRWVYAEGEESSSRSFGRAS